MLRRRLFPRSAVRRSVRSSRRQSVAVGRVGAVCDALEPRTMLTTFVVDSLSDDPTVASATADGHLTLREALIAANTNTAYGDAAAGSASFTDKIVLADSIAGGTIDLSGSSLVISDDVEIDGNGVTVDANGQSRGLLVGGNSRSLLRDIAIIDGATESGGGIAVEGSKLVLRGVKLAGSSAAVAGGGLAATDSVVLVAGSEIENNTAGLGGGGISIDGGSLRVERTNFSGNTGGVDGSFTSGGGGGAIWVKDTTARVVRSTFFSNTAVNQAGDGGAIRALDGTDLDVFGSTFIGNRTDEAPTAGRGGAIRGDAGTTVQVDTSLLEANEAGFGGAISTAGVIKVKDSTLTGNQSAFSGGAIDATRTAGAASITRVVGSVLTDNGSDNGGAIATQSAAVRIIGSVIGGDSVADANKARFDGGGLFVGGGPGTQNVEILSTGIAGNQARFSGGGIDFNARGGLLKIGSGSVVSGNAAGSGGGVAVRPTTTAGTLVRIINSTVSDNAAEREGGGLNLQALSEASLDTLVLGATFRGNTAGLNFSATGIEGGGAIRAAGTLFVKESLLKANTATGRGGAIYVADGETKVRKSRVRDNIAALGQSPDPGPSGGAIFAEVDAVLLTALNAIGGNTRIGLAGPSDGIVRH